MKSKSIQLETDILDALKTLASKLKKKHIAVFLFGSRITGQAKAKSDIDIGLSSKNKIEAKIIDEFSENLEKIPTFYKFDLVDFAKTSDGFKKNALKNTYLLN